MEEAIGDVTDLLPLVNSGFHLDPFRESHRRTIQQFDSVLANASAFLDLIHHSHGVPFGNALVGEDLALGEEGDHRVHINRLDLAGVRVGNDTFGTAGVCHFLNPVLALAPASVGHKDINTIVS